MSKEKIDAVNEVYQSLKAVTKNAVSMDLHIGENGEVTINKEWVKNHAARALLVEHSLKQVVDLIFDDIADKATYKARKQWAEEKDYERKLNKNLEELPVEEG